MGKKRKLEAQQGEKLQDLIDRPWCYYCEKDFDNIKILLGHQKVKHFRCTHCGKKLTTTSGLTVHSSQVHRVEVTSIDNAMPGREATTPEIFCMEGVPHELLAAHHQRVTTAYFQREAERQAMTGNRKGGIQGEPFKRQKNQESIEQMKARMARNRAEKQAAKAAGVDVNMKDAPAKSAHTTPPADQDPFAKQQSEIKLESEMDDIKPVERFAANSSVESAGLPQQRIPMMMPGTLDVPLGFSATHGPHGLSTASPYSNLYMHSYGMPQVTPPTMPKTMQPNMTPIMPPAMPREIQERLPPGMLPPPPPPGYMQPYIPPPPQPLTLALPPLPTPGLPQRPSFEMPNPSQENMQRMHMGLQPTTAPVYDFDNNTPLEDYRIPKPGVVPPNKQYHVPGRVTAEADRKAIFDDESNGTKVKEAHTSTTVLPPSPRLAPGQFEPGNVAGNNGHRHMGLDGLNLSPEEKRMYRTGGLNLLNNGPRRVPGWFVADDTI